MSTVKEVWGFSHYLAVDLDGTLGDRFLAAMNAEALDRGITPNVPSDALDASRNVIMDDAARKVGAEWSIVDDTLRVCPRNVTVDWAEVERVAEAEGIDTDAEALS